MKKRIGFVLLLAALAVGGVQAGSLPLAWTAATDSDLVGYRICWGPTSGTYPTCADVGLVTSYTLTGLPDCKDSFVCVKARDAAGQVSATCSEVKGWPQVEIVAQTKRSIELGASLTATVTGANFKPGALVYLDNGASRITATNVSVAADCKNVTFTVPTLVTHPAVDWSLSVENTDATWRSLQSFAATVANGTPTAVQGVRRTDLKP